VGVRGIGPHLRIAERLGQARVVGGVELIANGKNVA